MEVQGLVGGFWSQELPHKQFLIERQPEVKSQSLESKADAPLLGCALGRGAAIVRYCCQNSAREKDTFLKQAKPLQHPKKLLTSQEHQSFVYIFEDRSWQTRRMNDSTTWWKHWASAVGNKSVSVSQLLSEDLQGLLLLLLSFFFFYYLFFSSVSSWLVCAQNWNFQFKLVIRLVQLQCLADKRTYLSSPISNN